MAILTPELAVITIVYFSVVVNGYLLSKWEEAREGEGQANRENKE